MYHTFPGGREQSPSSLKGQFCQQSSRSCSSHCRCISSLNSIFRRDAHSKFSGVVPPSRSIPILSLIVFSKASDSFHPSDSLAVVSRSVSENDTGQGRGEIESQTLGLVIPTSAMRRLMISASHGYPVSLNRYCRMARCGILRFFI